MSKWIWKFGEFEMYHNMMVHSKRQAYGYVEAPVWKVFAPEVTVNFRKTFESQGGKIRIYACGDFSTAFIDENANRYKEFRGRSEVELDEGEITLEIRVINTRTFPAIFVEGAIESDETWMADDMTLTHTPVGFWDIFNSPEKRPDRFPFSYKREDYASKEDVPDGVLFDFGREMFSRVEISNLSDKEETFRIQYGESREEALDAQWSVTHFDLPVNGGNCKIEPYAFRYIFLSDKQADICAESEYLPFEKKGSFVCDDEVINRIWSVADETFHLNCREFFLDGIKRDRWVWSADAYQSLFVNRYLFGDPEIEKRTLIALGGKRPFERYINTIVDYTFFWIMSIYEHYVNYGDIEFLRQILPQIREVLAFCEKRTDEDGFIRGRKQDWIFIDWADMDKTGAVLGVQVLYARALCDYAKICFAVGVPDDGKKEVAESMQQKILELYWNSRAGAFIDSYESGRQNITRQNNILAYLFLPCTDEQKEAIYKNVIENDKIPAITTPYFTFYENQVHCLSGHDERLEEMMHSYYGSMLDLGATSLYEHYDPHDEGVEHYAMYGRPFEKSLCHAWSASPIYLLGAFRLGVRNTGIAYDSFEVSPNLGAFREISGEVPVPGGMVRVAADGSQVSVYSDISGGTLVWKGKQYAIDAGKEICIKE